MKHSRQCFIGYSDTSNFFKNTPLHVVFSTPFSMFGYFDETLSVLFDTAYLTCWPYSFLLTFIRVPGYTNLHLKSLNSCSRINTVNYNLLRLVYGWMTPNLAYVCGCTRRCSHINAVNYNYFWLALGDLWRHVVHDSSKLVICEMQTGLTREANVWLSFSFFIIFEN